MNNLLGGGLSTQLVGLVMAVSVASLTVIAVININISQQALKNDTGLRLNVIASDRMLALKNIWSLRLEQAVSLASHERVLSFLDPPVADAEKEAIRVGIVEGILPEFQRLAQERESRYFDVRMAGPDGRVVLASEDANQDLTEQTLARASRGPFYAIGFDHERQIATLSFVAPVVRAAGETPAGFVIVITDLNAANRILSDKLFLGQTGEAYLVSNRGLMLTDSRFVGGARHTQLVNTFPVQECLRNGADVNGAQYQNYRGIVVFGASSCEKNLGIILISEVDSAELFGPLLDLQSQVLVIAAAVIAAAGIMSFVLSSSILKPLQRLRSTMRLVQNGMFQKVDIVRRDEIGELASSFNTMVEEIGIKTKKLALKNDILSFMSSRLQVQADELIKADREKEEFSLMVSHELKTFLVPIIGYSELLLDGTLGEINRNQKEKAEVILERAWSLLYLTQNVLDARRLESGDLKMNLSDNVAADRLVEECVSRSAPLVKARRLNLVPRAENVTCRCDPPRVLQVLDNLLSNAVKAIQNDRSDGLIEVSATKRDDCVLFAVKDNGTGIPKENQKGIFKKFYEIDKSLTRQAAGKGLGLAISRGIVEAHGGRIWLESAPGSGSTFYFSLPIAPARAGQK